MVCNNISYTWYFYELLDVKRAIFGKITQERAATTAASDRLSRWRDDDGIGRIGWRSSRLTVIGWWFICSLTATARRWWRDGDGIGCRVPTTASRWWRDDYGIDRIGWRSCRLTVIKGWCSGSLTATAFLLHSIALLGLLNWWCGSLLRQIRRRSMVRRVRGGGQWCRVPRSCRLTVTG